MTRASGAPDQNAKPSITVVDSVTEEPFAQQGNSANGAAFVEPITGFTLPQYDYVSMALSVGNTVETYTFKVGGAGGSTVATIIITYTDSTRTVLVSAALT